MAKVGVDAVGEGDVDDAVLAGEGDGWLGAIAGEGKSRSPAPPASKTPSVSLITPTLRRTRLTYESRQSDAQTERTRLTRNASLPRGD